MVSAPFPGKSGFYPTLDAHNAVLKAAQYADEAGLWIGSKAKVPVLNTNIGTLGNERRQMSLMLTGMLMVLSTARRVQCGDKHMRDVTGIFRTVITSHTDWMINTFYIALDILKENGFEISYWEHEENWASILVDEKSVGYVWRRYPLIAVEEPHGTTFKSLLKKLDVIVFLEVVSLESDLLKIDDPSMTAFLEEFSHLDSFTVSDLWFHTNAQ